MSAARFFSTYTLAAAEPEAGGRGEPRCSHKLEVLHLGRQPSLAEQRAGALLSRLRTAP